MTKREMYDVIANVIATADVDCKDEVLEMVSKEVAALDRKNLKAKERAAAKRAAGDELRARVQAVITDAAEPITVNGILEALNDDELSAAKITARTKQLVNDGVINREMVRINGRKLTAYVLA